MEFASRKKPAIVRIRSIKSITTKGMLDVFRRTWLKAAAIPKLVSSQENTAAFARMLSTDAEVSPD
jgi:hypothetical protein